MTATVIFAETSNIFQEVTPLKSEIQCYVLRIYPIKTLSTGCLKEKDS
jgi:hypothetical protein